MATLSASRDDLFAVTMLPAVLKSPSEGTLVAGMHRYFLAYNLLSYLTYIYAYAAHFCIYSATFWHLPRGSRQAFHPHFQTQNISILHWKHQEEARDYTVGREKFAEENFANSH